MTFEIVADAPGVAARAAELVAATIAGSSGTFRIALAGGSTPKAMYRLLATKFRDQVEWSRVDFFFGDERCVPPDHADSNFGMANQNLFDPLAIAMANMHRMQGELPPEQAAALYAKEIAPLGQPPIFDLVLLGIGPDGHTASLFPGTAALKASEPVVANFVAKMNSWRITLTAPVLSAARSVLITATGAEKAEALALALEGPAGSVPVQLVAPSQLIWLVDRAAASKLRKSY